MHTTHTLDAHNPSFVQPDMVRATRLGTVVDYGRRQVQDFRGDRVYGMLEQAGKDGISTKDIASKLGISEGAARHGVWRMRGGPAKDGLRHPDLKVASLVGRNKFVLDEHVIDAETE
jgi:hypothetical protein